MLRIYDLRDYKKPVTMDAVLRDTLLKALQNKEGINESKATRLLFYFEIFLDCFDYYLSFIDLNRNLSEIYIRFFVFIYQECDLSSSGKYCIVNDYTDAIHLIYRNNKLTPPDLPKVYDNRISDDIKKASQAFDHKKINIEKLKYYHGWHATSSDHKKVKLYLHNFYLHFGLELTETLSASMQHLYIKYPASTAKYKAKVFVMFLNCLPILFKNSDEFYIGGKSTNVAKIVEQVFIICKLENKIKGNDIRYFYKNWSTIVKIVYDTLIQSKIWCQPLYELIVPEFKSSSKTFKTHRKIINGEVFSRKLITDIPLSYTDSQAMESLLISLENDISHVVTACKKAVDVIMKGYSIRDKFASQGVARDFKRNRHLYKYYTDMSEEKNQCATWEKYNYNLIKNNISISTFLGISGITTDFIRKYSIVQNDMLYPFLYLLVYEHPIITNSWLETFKLFDKNGNTVGFIESSDSKLAIGNKPRRSAKNAEQKIVLNERSEYLFDCLIKLTSQARGYLKQCNKDDYVYILLSGNSFGKPSRVKNLRAQKVFSNSTLNDYLLAPSNYADTERAKTILSNLTLSRFRASCAVQVYLQTNSIEAIAEALGHKKPCPRLLERYLPDPILKFFQERWIRIFQNAIIFEAMKNSEYLFDAIDIDEKALDKFLLNHRLKPLPKHILQGKLDDISPIFKENRSNKFSNDKLIIPLSTSLLSVLKCIVHLVEIAPAKSNKITRTAKEWYQTARYIINSLDETQKRRADPDLQAIIESSTNIDPLLIKMQGAIYEC
ncbi:hypothetical protein [Spartinivicinus poritis]|uniref:Uncharacterized protein n=1 Tax=Spartinivicinus poritis TaxID=2994640 RepID=A0ABT5U8S0_9GAMM|nr:hypothetical protein [Spartinivicinus sp. A2-2]MDE1462585.1 hypothetical protein [Spartinivicinus sp. A2-2]